MSAVNELVARLRLGEFNASPAPVPGRLLVQVAFVLVAACPNCDLTLDDGDRGAVRCPGCGQRLAWPAVQVSHPR